MWCLILSIPNFYPYSYYAFNEDKTSHHFQNKLTKKKNAESSKMVIID